MLGYTSWHQLFVYSCDSWLLSSFMLLCSYLSVVCLSCYLVIFDCSLSCYYSMHIVYMHELSSLHTHLSGHFLTTLDLHIQILDALFLFFRCSLRLYASRIAGVLPILFWYSYLFSLRIISRFLLYQFSCYSSLHLYDIMRGCLYVILQYSWFITVRFIACFGLLKA